MKKIMHETRNGGTYGVFVKWEEELYDLGEWIYVTKDDKDRGPTIKVCIQSSGQGTILFDVDSGEHIELPCWEAT